MNCRQTRRSGPRSAAGVEIGSECQRRSYGPVIGLYRKGGR